MDKQTELELRAIIRDELRKVFRDVQMDSFPAYTIAQCAKRLGRTRQFVQTRVDSRELHSVIRSGKVVIPKWAFDSFYEKINKEAEDKINDKAKIEKDPNLLNITEAAKFMGCSRGKIYRFVDAGKLKIYMQGNRPFISKEEAEPLIRRKLVHIE